MGDVNLLPYTPPTHWAPSRNTYASVELVKMNLPGPEHDMNITWLAEYFAKPGPRSAAHLEFERKVFLLALLGLLLQISYLEGAYTKKKLWVTPGRFRRRPCLRASLAK